MNSEFKTTVMYYITDVETDLSGISKKAANKMYAIRSEIGRFRFSHQFNAGVIVLENKKLCRKDIMTICYDDEMDLEPFFTYYNLNKYKKVKITVSSYPSIDDDLMDIDSIIRSISTKLIKCSYSYTEGTLSLYQDNKDMGCRSDILEIYGVSDGIFIDFLLQIKTRDKRLSIIKKLLTKYYDNSLSFFIEPGTSVVEFIEHILSLRLPK